MKPNNTRNAHAQMRVGVRITDNPYYKKRLLNSIKLLAAFLLAMWAQEKSSQKRSAEREISRSAERDQGSAFGNRKLFEKA